MDTYGRPVKVHVCPYMYVYGYVMRGRMRTCMRRALRYRKHQNRYISTWSISLYMYMHVYVYVHVYVYISVSVYEQVRDVLSGNVNIKIDTFRDK